MRTESRIRVRVATAIAAAAFALTMGAAVVAPAAPMAQTHASVQTHA